MITLTGSVKSELQVIQNDLDKKDYTDALSEFLQLHQDDTNPEDQLDVMDLGVCLVRIVQGNPDLGRDNVLQANADVKALLEKNN